MTLDLQAALGTATAFFPLSLLVSAIALCFISHRFEALLLLCTFTGHVFFEVLKVQRSGQKQFAQVVREGTKRLVPTECLDRGDLVVIHANQKIVGDGFLITGHCDVEEEGVLK